MSTIEYGRIEPDISNARAVQRLTLDSLAPILPDPDTIANPNSVRLVNRQLGELRTTPDRFVGAFIKGQLSGYVKMGDWTIEDELPYAIAKERVELRELRAKGAVYPAEFKLGVFGLAVSYELADSTADEIYDYLLHRVTDAALGFEHSAVNAAFYHSDPARVVAMDQGFKYTDRIHDELCKHGIEKRLYTKPLDI